MVDFRHGSWKEFFRELDDADIKLYVDNELCCKINIEELYQHFENRLIASMSFLNDTLLDEIKRGWDNEQN